MSEKTQWRSFIATADYSKAYCVGPFDTEEECAVWGLIYAGYWASPVTVELLDRQQYEEQIMRIAEECQKKENAV